MNTVILGLDPGFKSFGWAVLLLLPDVERVLAMGVIRTEKSPAKRHILATEDNLRRAREIAAQFRPLLKHGMSDVRAICAESMSFPRNASAAAKMAMSWGIVASYAHQLDLPIIQATPQEIKKKVCSGKKDASKDEVRDALLAKYPGAEQLLAGIPNGEHEHAWDALASIVAALDSETLRLARRMSV